MLLQIRIQITNAVTNKDTNADTDRAKKTNKQKGKTAFYDIFTFYNILLQISSATCISDDFFLNFASFTKMYITFSYNFIPDSIHI